MKIKLNPRGKHLTHILIVILGFLLWYKVYFGTLLPKYQVMENELIPYFQMDSFYTQLQGELEDQRDYQSYLKDEITALKNKFSSHSNFLLNTLASLAKDKITITGIEPGSLLHEDIYQIHRMEIEGEGSFINIMDYLKSLEKQPGLKIDMVEIYDNNELEDNLITRLVIRQYLIGREEVLATPSYTYSSYGPSHPFGKETIPDEESILEEGDGVDEEYITEEDFSLAPYSFPSR